MVQVVGFHVERNLLKFGYIYQLPGGKFTQFVFHKDTLYMLYLIVFSSGFGETAQ